MINLSVKKYPFRWTTLSRNLLTGILCVGMLAGCSSTSTKSDPNLAEMQQSDTISEFAAQEQRAPLDMPDASSVADPEQSTVTGEIAPHINAKIRGAIENANSGRIDAAISTLTDLVDEPQGGFLAAFNLGVLYERRAEYDVAARRYLQSLQKYPDFSPALVNLTRIYIRQDRTSDADEFARRFIEMRPDNLEHRAARLEIFLAQKRYEDVIRAARDILRKDERHIDAMLAMAQANYQLERYELGLAILRSAVNLAPQRAEIYYLYGNIELAMNQAPAAMANYRRAVELQPDYPEARNNLGLLYHEARDYNAAIEQYLAALDGFPDYKEAYLNLGNAYKGSARFKEAEGAFLRAISLDNSYADAYFNLGILYLESDIPGTETVPRLHKSIEAFNLYRQAARGTMAAEDPTSRFIEEANKSIVQAKQREEMAKRAQIQAEETAATESDPEEAVDEDE